MGECFQPHCGCCKGGAGGDEAQNGKQHYNSIEARSGVALELAHCGLCQGGHEIVENLGEDGVDAFASWLAVLSLVDELMVSCVVHCPASE